MSTFPKWTKLPSELRDHSLSYCYSKELGQYAQLSKVCNNDIQKFNTVAPKFLELRGLKNESDGIVIRGEYSTRKVIAAAFLSAGENRHRFVKSFVSVGRQPILDGNVRHAAFTYLEKLLKYMTTTKIEEMRVDCEEWPSEELRRIPAILKISDWHVQMYPSMCDAFMNFMYETTNVKKLHLDGSGINRQLVMPPQFFSSAFFKQLERAVILVKGRVSDEDFLTSNATFLHLTCVTISETAINTKIQQWYESTLFHYKPFGFTINRGNDRKWHKGLVIRNLPFYNEQGCFKLQRQDGKTALVYIYDTGVLSFDTQ